MYYDVISHYPFISISERCVALSVLRSLLTNRELCFLHPLVINTHGRRSSTIQT